MPTRTNRNFNVFVFQQTVITPNLYLYKVCAVNFGVNETLCDPRGKNSRNHTALADQVQSYVSTLNIYASIIEHVPSIFLMLFVLPWSDVHGRKPLLILPLIGHIVCTLIEMANFYSTTWPAEYLLIGTVPLGVTGAIGIFGLAINR